MTRDEAVAMIQQQLGFRTTLSTEIVAYMKLAQHQLEQLPTKPWFLRSEYAHIYTEPNEARLPVPNDFLQEVEEDALWYIEDPTDDEEAPTPLYKDDMDQLAVRLAGTGVPEAYALDGLYFRLYPTPDDEYYIRMIYYKKGAELSTNIENVWLKYAPKLLMGATGLDIAAATRDMGAVKIFESWRAEGAAALASQNEARQHAGRSYQIGGDH